MSDVIIYTRVPEALLDKRFRLPIDYALHILTVGDQPKSVPCTPRIHRVRLRLSPKGNFYLEYLKKRENQSATNILVHALALVSEMRPHCWHKIDLS